MTLQTRKFSEFVTANLNKTNRMVGLSDGANAIFDDPVSWTVATRPVTPSPGLLGFNTDLQKYEYFNAILGVWVQLVTTPGGGGGITSWDTVTDPSVAVAVNEGIVANRSATPVQVVLPALFAVGDEIGILGLGTGGWNMVANAGQQIIFGSQISSIAGGINSDITNANIFIRGLVANTLWTVELANSNPTII